MAKNKVASNLQNSVTEPSKQAAVDPVDNYEVKDHLRTLQEAHGIINDSSKMAKVHKLAGRHAKALAGIKSIPMQDETPEMKSTDDLKKHYNDKFGSGAKKQKNSLASLKNSVGDEG